MAEPVGRKKYEIAARVAFGRALVAMKRPEEAIAPLQTAVADADGLGTPPGRWGARAALGEALVAVGRDDDAESAFTEAKDTIEAVASTLASERAERFLSAEPIQRVLRAGD